MPASTARGAFPYPLGDDAPDTDGAIRALAERMAAAGALFEQGAAAARPQAAAARAGLFFLATDTGALSYCTGSAWIVLLRADGKAADAELLDGQEAAAFLTRTDAAAGFLPLNGKAADSNLLDGIDSTGFVKVADQAWQRLGEVALGAAGLIVLNNIPNTFRHLRVVFSGRSNLAAADDGLYVRLNANAGALYTRQTLLVAGSSVSASEATNVNHCEVGRVPAANSPDGRPAGAYELLLPDANRNVYHQALLSDGVNARGYAGGNTQTVRTSGLYAAWEQITSIDIGCVLGAPAAGSLATLYGMKGA